jgi:enamine deaminase RidA (YjgF/YER057c/UK114 family)
MTAHPPHIQFINPPAMATPPGFTHVVKLNIYLVDMTHLPILREVRDRYVNTQHPPASTAVEVRKLALDELLLEIEAVASLPA